MTPALLVYRGLTWLAVLAGLPYLIYRHWRHPDEMRERWGGGSSGSGPDDASQVPGDAGPVWVHAASLGEIEAVRAWMEERPFREGVSWFATVTSTSARRRAGERLGSGVAVSFAPIDHDLAVGRFLRHRRPVALVLLETELWPVTLDRCRRAGIPVYVASGRISDPAWRKVQNVARLYREVASAVRGVAAQGPEDARRFEAIGIGSVRVCGNVKYRVGREPSNGSAAESGSELVSGSAAESGSETPLVWVIGSLRRGEEAVLASARRVAETGAYVVLAPRHLREMNSWAASCRAAGLDPVLRSETSNSVLADPDGLRNALAPRKGAGPDTGIGEVRPRILLVDVHGELRSWYARAGAATVGGTWTPIGGHNLFEPISVGAPVSFGPHIANVRDVAEAALSEGAGFQTDDPARLVEWVLSQGEAPIRQKTERSALRTARMLAGAGERTRAFLSEAEASEAWGGIFRP